MMKIVLCVSLALSCALAYENSDFFINEINSKQNLWKAGRNFAENTPLSTIKGLLGAKILPKEIFESIPLKQHQITGAIPESFDSRTQWSKCKTVSEIADQSSCGSCWAVSVASAISDRICIHSDGQQQPEISAKNLMSCNGISHGCQGGYPYYAWKHWCDEGLVTGGPYGSKIGCQPYPFASCEHHIDGSKPKCPATTYSTPKCVKQCDNSTLDYSKDLIKGGSVYRVSSDETQIQQEIMKNGPVVASFRVYSDFIQYKSGVYAKTTGTYQGGHAVRVIGWGVEKGTKYWLIANSWNEDWGEKGLFKILRGKDESGIESQITSGLPK